MGVGGACAAQGGWGCVQALESANSLLDPCGLPGPASCRERRAGCTLALFPTFFPAVLTVGVLSAVVRGRWGSRDHRKPAGLLDRRLPEGNVASFRLPLAWVARMDCDMTRVVGWLGGGCLIGRRLGCGRSGTAPAPENSKTAVGGNYYYF